MYPESDYLLGKVYLRLWPTEDKMFYAALSVFDLDEEGTVDFKRKFVGQDDTETKFDLMAGWKIPWFLDRTLLVRGGILEGRLGAAAELELERYIGYPVVATLEGRQGFDSIREDRIDEHIGGFNTLIRAYLSAPLYHGHGDDFLSVVGTKLRATIGFSNILDDPEFMAGIGFEYEDRDVRTLFGLAGLSR
jgi:hypothetical protein